MVATNGDAGVRDRGRASSPHARAAYAGALQGLGAWLDGRPLDRNLADGWSCDFGWRSPHFPDVHPRVRVVSQFEIRPA